MCSDQSVLGAKPLSRYNIMCNLLIFVRLKSRTVVNVTFN